MAVRPHVRRYIDSELFQLHKGDLRFLADMARRSRGQLQLLFRENRVILYHQGNLVVSVAFAGKKYEHPFMVAFGARFVTKSDKDWSPLGEWDVLGLIEKLAGCEGSLSGGYYYFNLDAPRLKLTVAPEVIRRVCAAIRAIDYGGEITFEQLLMAQNPPSRDLIMIDRQIADSHPDFGRKRMDVLALRRLSGVEDRYRFVVLELKLGGNPSATGEVIEQLKGYMSHIKTEAAADYKRCYERMYEQNRALGLYKGIDLPAHISIDVERVDGMVVVGYSPEELEATLKGKVVDEGIELRFLHFRLT